MSRVLKNELQTLRESLMKCFRETPPSRQVNALLSLSAIWLHVLADRHERIQDPKERRRLEDEFDHGKRVIEQGIRKLGEQPERKPFEELLPDPMQYLQRLRSAGHP